MVISVGSAIDDFFSHNAIVGLWVEQKDENGSYHEQFWRGEAWKMPDKFRGCELDEVFGTIPDNMEKAGDINISVCKDSYNFHYEHELHERFLRGEQEVKEYVIREECSDHMGKSCIDKPTG